ncbi:MAG: prepilin-type N-terminal cleavage/methylation domain-containing protein [Planctomycetota bacterium]
MSARVEVMNMQAWSTGRKERAYTLIEMLVVLAIIMVMMSLVIMSVSSMLQSNRMSRSLSLIVGAVDEARTQAICYRRTTKLDLTRIDEAGMLSRLTVSGPFFNDNFDSYNDATAAAPTPTPASNGWMTTGSWVGPGPNASIYSDGTRCLRMADGQKYWNLCSRVDTVKQEDFEQIVMARVKFLPSANRSGDRSLNIYACIQDAATMGDAYCMTLTITPWPNGSGLNNNSAVTLGKSGGGSLNPVGTAVGQLAVDLPGPPVQGGSPASATACLIENVWYRVMISVKRATDNSNPASATTKATVAGKFWADGQLEPLAWTVGPLQDNSPLFNGPGGFGSTGCDSLVDDVLFDGRPIRIIPVGLRLDALGLTSPTADPGIASSWDVALLDSPSNFPWVFRPDGTTAQRYLAQLMDLTSGDKAYMAIDQNTGHARMAHTLQEAIQP